MTIADERFERAMDRFDEANSEDPNRETFEGAEHAKELVYARRMTRWLERLAPDASEPLKLAARCQHIRRWEIPRSDFPTDRVGYHRWRKTLQKHHAEIARSILVDVGYEPEKIERVKSLLKKENLSTDAEMQTLEDVICLVFLEDYFAAFATKHDEEKLVEIVRKTWKKMSPRGHEAALALELGRRERALVEQAIG